MKIAVPVVICIALTPMISFAEPDAGVSVCIKRCEEKFIGNEPAKDGCMARCNTEKTISEIGSKADTVVDSGVNHAEKALDYIRGFFSRKNVEEKQKNE